MLSEQGALLLAGTGELTPAMGYTMTEQDGAIVRGNTIDYYIEKQLVKADSLSDQADNRVEVVIPASTARGDEE